jgi:nickel/cobalt exporter
MPPFEGKRLRLRPTAAGDHVHHDGHTHHDHEHGHGENWHSHGPFSCPHRHMPDGGEEVTLKGLLTLGVSGGLLPCPSALVVLLSAIALHRVGFGLLLIVAFSLGLAGVLTGIGLLLAYARRLADRLPVDSGAIRFLPVISACAVAMMGLAVTVQSLAGGGIIRLL